jgi:hypothetical protein
MGVCFNIQAGFTEQTGWRTIATKTILSLLSWESVSIYRLASLNEQGDALASKTIFRLGHYPYKQCTQAWRI